MLLVRHFNIPYYMSAVDTFEHIIRHQGAPELVPFLLELEKKDMVAVRTKTRALTKELEEHRQLGVVTWGRVGTDAQISMLFLAAVATYSRKEAQGLSNGIGVGWGEGAELLVNQGYFFSVAAHARPVWFVEWLQRRSRGGPWGLPDYAFLRQMEARTLLEYEPGLFAQTLAHSLNSRSYSQRHKEVVRNYREVLLQEFADSFAFIQRDLLACFEYDTTIDSTAAYTGVRHEQVLWQDILLHLTSTHHLSRTDLLSRSLLSLRRDFRRPLLTWFKNIFLGLKCTVAERLERQQELVELLSHPQPLVLNFALDQLKALWTEPKFDLSTLLVYADALVTRHDLKTGVRTLLSGFEKMWKRNHALAPDIARLSAAALANTDASVQEKAAKVLAAILQANKLGLAATEAAEILEVAGGYADLLTPGARTLLDPWLAKTDGLAVASHDETDGYQPKKCTVPELSEATAISPVQDWHELLFLTGQVLRHEDPSILERWVDGLLRLQAAFPSDYVKQLQPYVVHTLPFVRGRSEAEAEAIIAKHSQGGHFGVVQALFLSLVQGFRTARVQQVNLTEAFYVADPLVRVDQLRLAAAEECLTRRTGLSLLSMPTHSPYWVAPSTLVGRLLAYEANNVAPDAADIAIALARTAFAHQADAHAAHALLPLLQHEGLRQLLDWFLAQSVPTLPVSGEKKSLVRHLTERLGKLLPSTAIVPASVTEAMPWLWAVAARTKYPNETFEQLAALTGSDYPGVVQPWKPEWVFDVKTNTYVEQWKPGKPVVTHRSTQLAFPTTYTSKVPPSPLLLYSQYVRFAGMNHANVALSVDYPFVASLIPNHPAPLHWHVLRTAGWADKLESTERDVIKQALRAMLEIGPIFVEPTTRLLACGLTHSTPECRALALEVLLSAIQNQQVLPDMLGAILGQLLAVEFVPVQRLVDNLVQVRAINAVTDDALRQILGAVVLELSDKPPRNTRKLLEAYADFVGRSGQPVPVPVQERLQAWSQEVSLKKTIVSLLLHSKPSIATAFT
jgi:hypothetical protein